MPVNKIERRARLLQRATGLQYRDAMRRVRTFSPTVALIRSPERSQALLEGALMSEVMAYLSDPRASAEEAPSVEVFDALDGLRIRLRDCSSDDGRERRRWIETVTCNPALHWLPGIRARPTPRGVEFFRVGHPAKVIVEGTTVREAHTMHLHAHGPQPRHEELSRQRQWCIFAPDTPRKTTPREIHTQQQITAAGLSAIESVLLASSSVLRRMNAVVVPGLVVVRHWVTLRHVVLDITVRDLREDVVDEALAVLTTADFEPQWRLIHDPRALDFGLGHPGFEFAIHGLDVRVDLRFSSLVRDADGQERQLGWPYRSLVAAKETAIAGRRAV